jgi:hypothetical protein
VVSAVDRSNLGSVDVSLTASPDDEPVGHRVVERDRRGLGVEQGHGRLDH